MSKLICAGAIEGAAAWVAQAEKMVARAIEQKGADGLAAFPHTDGTLPVIRAFTGKAVRTLGELEDMLAEVRSLLPAPPDDTVWLPYLGGALDAGAATLFAWETVEACKYVLGPSHGDGIWLGAADDVIVHERGFALTDGTVSGVALVMGAAPDNATAVELARVLREKNLYVFMGGSANGKQFAEQLAEEGVPLGWETHLISLGADVSALIYALGFVSRVALSFGGVTPGDGGARLPRNENSMAAFVLALGDMDEGKYAAAAGAAHYGLPVLADRDTPLLPAALARVVSGVPYGQMAEKALEVCGCETQAVKVPLPVSYGPAFAGERIPREDTHVEFGGPTSVCFQVVTRVERDAVNDGGVEIIGPDIDKGEPGMVRPLAIWVEVAGRKMQSDFEPVFEEQIHRFLNEAEGIRHMGQGDAVRTRVGKKGFARGLRLRHYGEILRARFLADYPAIAEWVKVTLVTDEKEVLARQEAARRIYSDRRRAELTDESADVFYTCLRCRAFAPDHVCVITPERPGACGACSWPDAKMARETDETGPVQPLDKGACLDPVKGVWEGVNASVYANSHETVESVAAYTIMDRPMTSSLRLEAVIAHVPACNGVMIVDRAYRGDTPAGMTFPALADCASGGRQTPGCIGVSKAYLTSRKFLCAEGGFARIVWMPKELKAALRDDLCKRLEEQALEGLFDQIADETAATGPEALRACLEKEKHPALTLPDMNGYRKKEEADPSAPSKTAAETGERQEDTESAPSAAGSAVNVETMKRKLMEDMRALITREVVDNVINTLSRSFLDGAPVELDIIAAEASAQAEPSARPSKTGKPDRPGLSSFRPVSFEPAALLLSQVKFFSVPRETMKNTVWTVKLGNTASEGGTRRISYTVGGASCMPFHLWEGDMPYRPLVAMEVFDQISEPYPPVLRDVYGPLLKNPVEMARVCVKQYGADLISVRLDGIQSEGGRKSAVRVVALIKEILQAVDVPLIITGADHAEKNNEVLKAVAAACEGENLLINGVEQDNYRAVAGAALAYGHTVAARSPADINIGKQLNILLTNMGFEKEKILMDPTASAIGYGIESTCSVMERIRLTGLRGDDMLCAPMIVSVGAACAKSKECREEEGVFPLWGDLDRRLADWETATAATLLYAGADVLILYHPEAVKTIKEMITQLLDGRNP